MAEKTELSGVRAKLKAHKDANAGDRTITLSESGISCTVPNFINHGLWMKAQRVAKGDMPKAQAAFVCEVVRFEGEKLNLTDLAELVSSGDTLQLIGEIFGGKDDNAEGEPGNVLN
ncbi:hypothetical protein [Brucella sp. 2280]|uniref:hypothetical protein n=1 Tax=Brucella sp. 2280 TaxID=2592625 RepID=UPI001294E59E|nr:hypothetical protein [Brucella sp. 2280]QGA56160.1 hypothetical protein GHC20_03255 [Brucella sp. 2280]